MYICVYIYIYIYDSFTIYGRAAEIRWRELAGSFCGRFAQLAPQMFLWDPILYIYIYIYRERERDIDRERERDICICVCIHI